MKKPLPLQNIAPDIPATRGDRKLVWHDEFTPEENLLDQWMFRTQMFSTDVILSTDTDKHAVIRDGQLHLLTERTDGADGKDYIIPMALTTFDKMVFRRGYLEMRANIPFRHGTWPSFWMLTYEPLQTAEFRSEVDIFEIFSSKDEVVCNLHKSKREPDGHISARDALDGKMVSNRRFHFPHPENLNEEYHIYGLDWTETEMTFLIDNEPYITVSLTEDFSDKLIGMDCYQDYHFVILCNYVFTPGTNWHPEGYLMKPEDPCPVEYHVDWIRLYQKDGEDILVEE